MDKKFLVKMIIFAALAVFFLLLMFPYVFVSTPLHALVRIGNELAKNRNVANPKLSARWDERNRLSAIEVSYDTTPEVFADRERIEREMNQVLYWAWEEVLRYNGEIDAENKKERRETEERRSAGNLSARARLKMTFRPRTYIVVAHVRAGGGCSRKKVEKKELEYGELAFAKIGQFKRCAKRLSGKVKNHNNLDVTVVPSIVFPSGPFGVTLKAAGVSGENSSEILQETADWVLARWRFSTARLSWVEVVDAATGESAVAGDKGTREQGNKKTRKQGNKGTREQENKETRE